MNQTTFSRRRFASGLALAVGGLATSAGRNLLAQSRDPSTMSPTQRMSPDEYDAIVKLCFNENPYGPPASVMQAMQSAFKYSNRYAYPDGGLLKAIAAHHGVKPENILIGAGSTEILCIAGDTFLGPGKKVIGVEPTFDSVYGHATGLKAEAIRLPLRADFQQDIPAMIQAAKDHAGEVGFIYLCNPNNPTGAIVTKDEVKQLLDGIPENIPVLIDEAYHHFAENPNYATSDHFVTEGRPVLVTRTFSKIAALAGMRLGYGLAPAKMIEQMRPYSDSMSVNALVKFAGGAALKDTAAAERVRREIIGTRQKTISELDNLGYKVIPSEANFFMVDIRRDVHPVITAFREHGILVGRPFPPLLKHLRVSVGTPDEMGRFLSAFKSIVATA